MQSFRQFHSVLQHRLKLTAKSASLNSVLVLAVSIIGALFQIIEYWSAIVKSPGHSHDFLVHQQSNGLILNCCLMGQAYRRVSLQLHHDRSRANHKSWASARHWCVDAGSRMLLSALDAAVWDTQTSDVTVADAFSGHRHIILLLSRHQWRFE